MPRDDKCIVAIVPSNSDMEANASNASEKELNLKYLGTGDAASNTGSFSEAGPVADEPQPAGSGGHKAWLYVLGIVLLFISAW